MAGSHAIGVAALVVCQRNVSTLSSSFQEPLKTHRFKYSLDARFITYVTVPEALFIAG